MDHFYSEFFQYLILKYSIDRIIQRLHHKNLKYVPMYPTKSKDKNERYNPDQSELEAAGLLQENIA